MEEKQDRKEELLATLGEMAEQLTNSGGWQRWLELARRMHGYSAGNLLLIMAQRPDAQIVYGFRRWQELGRQVKKGEKAVWILAPIIKRIENDDPADPTVRRRVVAFRPAAVFDVSQTSGDDLPSRDMPPVRVPDEGLLDQLVGVARDAGYIVEFVPSRDTARGWFTPDTNTISIVDAAAYDTSSRVRTMLHELSHAVDPVIREKEWVRAERELVAESSAYLSAAALGIDTSDASAVYAAHWGGDKDRLVALAGQVLAASKAVDEITAPLRQLVEA